MWCNWGFMGGRMGWPHGFGIIGFLLLLGVIALLIALWRRYGSSKQLKCPACNGAVQPAYLRCPHCGATLKRHCPKCAGIIEADWKYCPTCDESVQDQRQ